MPEGHTIHRLARDLRRTLAGAPVRATSPQGRFAAGAALLDGEAIRSSEAWGKYLFVDFGDGRVLHVHLGLIGKFRAVDPSTPTRDSIRLRLTGDGGDRGPAATPTWDLTGPTRCEIITPPERRHIVANLGADPLRRRPDVTGAAARIRSTDKPIGAVLLDQSIIAGIGNVYRAELLFVCGIHPERPGSRLSDEEFSMLWSEATRLLRIGVRLGRIVTTDPVEIGRPRASMTSDDALYVYHRDHCRRCGTELTTVELGGRPMQFCPICQPR